MSSTIKVEIIKIILVKYLQNYDCVGYDISEWAISYGTNVLGACPITTSKEVLTRTCDATLFLDVLEHIEISEVNTILCSLESSYVFVRMPVTLKDNDRYVYDISENDPTHINRFSKRTWTEIFGKYNYQQIELLQSEHIWDSAGAFCAIFKKLI